MPSFVDPEHSHQHTSKQFDHELLDIRSRVLTLGGLVEEQVALAVRSLLEGNAELAERVIADDYKVNTMEVSIDDECTQILARRQPTARDLRLVVVVIKTITDLERIGDEAKRIARHALDMVGHFPRKNQLSEIEELARHVRNLLRSALDSFARIDVDAALRVVQDDRLADREYETILRQQITYMMEDPRTIPVSLNIMWSARALERVGDRACNIGEYVIYYAKGKIIRHISLEQLEEDLRSE
ncbi:MULTISPECIES: phosphate signaling complex protein PhoU [Methylococcus]|uniref:Phosphate-specific transport system accessory protein PhoU n=1 Tax=Methylococcus capsulatus TaxID=414 RepID=A0ABZ2FB22_METCP|nr:MULTISPECIES: phosphate signaling complex protein PhoU [Methylococcus]MDF9391277.1 phosphate signaling complex protein PhoU [Methylococcus capsulatus]